MDGLLNACMDCGANKYSDEANWASSQQTDVWDCGGVESEIPASLQKITQFTQLLVDCYPLTQIEQLLPPITPLPLLAILPLI